MCEMSSRKKRDEGWKRPGSLADFPRIARVYFRRRAAGTLPARVLDIRFWEMRSCGFNPWDDRSFFWWRQPDGTLFVGRGLWQWWLHLHWRERDRLVELSRQYGMREPKLRRRRWVPSEQQLNAARANSLSATDSTLRRTNFFNRELAMV